MTAQLEQVDPRIKHFSAALLVNATGLAEALLNPNGCTEEQLFEGFEALVWIWSPASTRYFEAVDRDPQSGRESLHLDWHIHVAVTLAERHRSLLLRSYVAMARSVGRMLVKKISTPDVKRYAEQELDRSLALLKSHCHIGTELPLPPGVGEIIRTSPSPQSTEDLGRTS